MSFFQICFGDMEISHSLNSSRSVFQMTRLNILMTGSIQNMALTENKPLKSKQCINRIRASETADFLLIDV